MKGEEMTGRVGRIDGMGEPLEIDYKWPAISTPLIAVAAALMGSSVGHFAVGMFTGDASPWMLIPLILGLVLASVWQFGIASDGACRRRYKKRRLAAIRRREDGSWGDGL